jgi:hypothetical protein
VEVAAAVLARWVPQAQRVTPVLRDLRVFKAQRAILVLKAPQVSTVFKVPQEQRVTPARRVFRA